MKRHKPEETVTKLRRGGVIDRQGMARVSRTAAAASAGANARKGPALPVRVRRGCFRQTPCLLREEAAEGLAAPRERGAARPAVALGRRVRALPRLSGFLMMLHWGNDHVSGTL